MIKSLFTYRNKEKLKSRKTIKYIFDEGKSIKIYPLLIRYKESYLEHQQVGVSVSKRNFKDAVDRNRIKRQLREAYRLHKSQLGSENKNYSIMILYIGKVHLKSEKIHKVMHTLLNDIK
jgi:ribonuclease P protein component